MPLLDPRRYQIACLTTLLVYGCLFLQFDIGLTQIAVTLGGTLGTQWACTRLWRLPRFDPASALISGLSLCLLLRTDQLWVAGAGAFLSIAGKFVLRMDGKHIWNPTNFGVATMMLLSDHAWVSPGQWGSAAVAAFAFACGGGLVVNRAERADITYAFLFFFLAALFGRSLWLGEPMTIPLHRLQSGAFLLFTFFMVSDPKTSADARGARILQAAAVAALAWVIQFRWFHTNGLIWSLFLLAPLTPVLDRLWKAPRYQWPTVRPTWSPA